MPRQPSKRACTESDTSTSRLNLKPTDRTQPPQQVGDWHVSAKVCKQQPYKLDSQQLCMEQPFMHKALYLTGQHHWPQTASHVVALVQLGLAAPYLHEAAAVGCAVAALHYACTQQHLQPLQQQLPGHLGLDANRRHLQCGGEWELSAVSEGQPRRTGDQSQGCRWHWPSLQCRLGGELPGGRNHSAACARAVSGLC